MEGGGAGGYGLGKMGKGINADVLEEAGEANGLKKISVWWNKKWLKGQGGLKFGGLKFGVLKLGLLRGAACLEIAL